MYVPSSHVLQAPLFLPNIPCSPNDKLHRSHTSLQATDVSTPCCHKGSLTVCVADNASTHPQVSRYTGRTTSLQLLDRQNSNAAAGPSKGGSRPLGRQRNSINYSLLAGNRKPDLKTMAGTVPKGSKKGGHKQSPAPQSDVRKDQAAISVAAAVAAGPTSIPLSWHCC